MQKFTVHSSWFTVGYVLGIGALFLYSFTQIDLSLTLSQASWVQQFQKSFQYIGYFERPLSTYLFVGIVALLYCLYGLLLVYIKRFSKKQLWGLILFSSILLGFAYNAFSYDLFNYIFDAKIITYYGQNPYEHKALDYAQDGEPMLSFMRWTHRVYPYGPVWLGITVPLSFLGMQYFLLTFFLFKALMVASFLGTVWYIGKILQKTYPDYEKLGIAFFALNPFVLIESVVSAHIDIVMMLFMMLGMYLLVQKKYIMTFVILVFTYGIKFASPEFPLALHFLIMLGLAFGLFVFSKIQKKLAWDSWFIMIGCLMIIPVILASVRTNFQPWYLLSLLPFAALASKKIYIVVPVLIISFFALLEYIPYLYFGNWDAPIPSYLFWIRVSGMVLAGLAGVIFLVQKRKNGTMRSL